MKPFLLYVYKIELIIIIIIVTIINKTKKKIAWWSAFIYINYSYKMKQGVYYTRCENLNELLANKEVFAFFFSSVLA